MFNTTRTVFYALLVCRQNKVFVCASACADAIQTRPLRLKMFILYSQKFHRTNIQSSGKLGRGHFSDPGRLFTGFAHTFYMHRSYGGRHLVLRLRKKRE